MTAETLDGPERMPAICRTSFEMPCRIEERLVQVLQDENLRLAQALHDDLANELLGTALCLAALRSRIATLDPGLGRELDEIGQQLGEAADRGCEVACSASSFVAAHHGLGAALRMRFREQAGPDGAPIELVLQAEAEQGLSEDEQVTLLRVAEEAAAQVQREGSRELRVALRRSRLGSVELTVSGGGGGVVASRIGDSYRSLALVRRLAVRIDARISVRRLEDESLLVRCRTRWPEDDEMDRWALPG